jgi:hypothetical protein
MRMLCPPLEALALISLHQAGRPGQPLVLLSSLRQWQEIMRRVQPLVPNAQQPGENG